jgi:YidC/Oxa1 family membrane protein insertase
LDSTRQIVIFVLLIVAAIFYADIVRWIRPPKAPTEQQTAQPTAGAAPSSAAPATTGAAGVQPSSSTQSSAGAGAAAPIATAAAPEVGIPEPESLTSAVMSTSPPRTVEIDTDLYEATVTAKGARLLNFRLKHYRETVRKDSPLYDVVVQGERLPMGLVIGRGDKMFADQGVDYTTDAPAQVEVSSNADTTVTFTADTKQGLKLTKRFTFRNGSYLYGIDAEVGGTTSDVRAVGFNMSQPLTERASLF